MVHNYEVTFEQSLGELHMNRGQATGMAEMKCKVPCFLNNTFIIYNKLDQ